MSLKRLVLLVEGEGDVEAAPVLLKRLLRECHAFDAVALDPAPLRVGEYSRLSKDDFAVWRRLLGAATKRKNVGGCLLILDGDSRVKVDGHPFCAMRAARRLAEEAQRVGAGTTFSVAVVFACMEFESWLIAGCAALAGQSLPDRRNGFPAAIGPLPPALESSPRDAKGWLRQTMTAGYKPTIDQADLAQLVDIAAIRRHGLRSFRRLESAISQLVAAARGGPHVASPPFKPTAP